MRVLAWNGLRGRESAIENASSRNALAQSWLWSPDPKHTPQASWVFIKIHREGTHLPGCASAWPQGFALPWPASPAPKVQQTQTGFSTRKYLQTLGLEGNGHLKGFPFWREGCVSSWVGPSLGNHTTNSLMSSSQSAFLNNFPINLCGKHAVLAGGNSWRRQYVSHKKQSPYPWLGMHSFSQAWGM